VVAEEEKHVCLQLQTVDPRIWQFYSSWRPQKKLQNEVSQNVPKRSHALLRQINSKQLKRDV